MNPSRLLERFFRYISCASESGSERPFCELLEAELRDLGLSVSRDAVGEHCGTDGWNVYAFLPGEGEPILFSAHLDTVAPGTGIRPIIKDGVIHSSGDTILGADDKSGIAAVMEALESIKEQQLPHRPVEVLFSVCEELGLQGAKCADYTRIKSRQAVVLDSGKMESIINQAPANMHLHIEITGKSAHAGTSPDQGVHALKAAAAAIANIPCGFVDDITVMNVANFSSPGKTNIVPDKAQFDMEIRSFDEERLLEHVKSTEAAVISACNAVGASYVIHTEKQSDVLYVPQDSALIKRLQDVYSELGVAARTDKTYGGSDATWIFHHGIDVANIGTGMQDVHSLTEHIAVADLELTARVVLAMMLPE